MSEGNGENQPSFRTTAYFDRVVLRKHWEANRFDWVQHVLEYYAEERSDPLHAPRKQRFGYIAEVDRYMRVVLEPDGAVHNAFLDENYGRKQRRRTV